MSKDPHCYWCGCEVRYFPLKRHHKVPHDYATLDHLNDRLTGDRPKLDGIETTVLACFGCNNARNAIKQAQLPKFFLWKRCGTYPLNYKDGDETK
jgi:hypothetical protein